MAVSGLSDDCRFNRGAESHETFVVHSAAIVEFLSSSVVKFSNMLVPDQVLVVKTIFTLQTMMQRNDDTKEGSDLPFAVVGMRAS